MGHNKNILRKKAANAIAPIMAMLLICLSITTRAQFHIIPEPQKITAKNGTFILKNNDVIGVDADNKTTGIYLQNYLAKNYNLHLKLRIKPTVAAIRLLIDSTRISGSYDLNIAKTYINITGNSDGIFYGIQSLIQLLTVSKPAPLRIAECTIADEPRFEWRGLSLDVSRHFFTIDG
jgi:hexosaminidase